jgi:glycerol uptake facilitator-like aquaporin
MKTQNSLISVFGTFMLVFLGCGSTILLKTYFSGVDLTTTLSLTIMLLVYTVCAIYGYNINPAVTLSKIFLHKAPIRQGIGHLAAQLLGGTFGWFALNILHPIHQNLIDQMTLLIMTSITTHLIIYLSSSEVLQSKRK